jgi:hypothetical protein
MLWEDYLDAGLIPIPTVVGEKKPLVMWTEYRDADSIDPENIRLDWSVHPGSDVSILLTDVQVIDVDIKNARDKSYLYNTFMRAIMAKISLNDRIYVEETPSRGLHIWYRPRQMKPSGVIATLVGPDADARGRLVRRPVVEMLGPGHLCRIFPCQGFMARMGNPANLPTLTDDECEYIERIGLLFNEYVPEVAAYRASEKKGEGRPGDDYSDNVSIPDFLSMIGRHGYEHVKTSGRREYIRRPGARTKNFDCDVLRKERVFMNYSTSVMDFDVGKGYSFFEVYTILEHGGNFAAAAQALADLGYGTHRDPMVVVGEGNKSSKEFRWDEDAADIVERQPYDPMWERLALESEFDLENPPKIEFTFSWADYTEVNPTRYDLSGPGTICLMLGKQKSRKTAALSAMIAAAIRQEPILGFSLKYPEGSDIVWIDTEQSKIFYWAVQRKIMVMANCRHKPANYYCYHLRRFNAKERLMLLKRIVANHPNLGVLVVDGIRDLMEDINDNKQITPVVDTLMNITSDTNCILFAVLHMNKSDDEARGAIGTEMQNKSDLVFTFKLIQGTDDTELVFRDIRGFKRPRPFIFTAGEDNIPYVPGGYNPEFDNSIGRKSKPVAHPDTFIEPANNTKDDEDIPF